MNSDIMREPLRGYGPSGPSQDIKLNETRRQHSRLAEYRHDRGTGEVCPRDEEYGDLTRDRDVGGREWVKRAF